MKNCIEIENLIPTKNVFHCYLNPERKVSEKAFEVHGYSDEFLSDKNRIREWKTPPQRGIITDYFNNVIADNQRVYQVHLSLEEVSNFNNSIFLGF